jgi:hypothetical protein
MFIRKEEEEMNYFFLVERKISACPSHWLSEIANAHSLPVLASSYK